MCGLSMSFIIAIHIYLHNSCCFLIKKVIKSDYNHRKNAGKNKQSAFFFILLWKILDYVTVKDNVNSTIKAHSHHIGK